MKLGISGLEISRNKYPSTCTILAVDQCYQRNANGKSELVFYFAEAIIHFLDCFALQMCHETCEILRFCNETSK